MSQETTTKLFFMGFFLHRLAQCAMHMPKLTFWHQDFLNSPRLWKSLRFCFSKKESLHTVSTMLAFMPVCQMLQICLSSAPPATFTSFQGFYLGSPVDAAPATLIPQEDFQPSSSKVLSGFTSSTLVPGCVL